MENGEQPRTDALSPIYVLAVLIRERRWILGTTAILVGAAGAFGLLRDRQYTSASAFIAQSKRGPALSGLAAQFGITMAGAEASQGPQFYADFVRSRQMFGAAADARYPDTQGQMHGLGVLLGVEQGDSILTREAVIADLGRRVAATVNSRTGVVRLTTRLPSAELARAINAMLLGLLNDFNLRTRQSQASAERAFTEGRLAEARQELRAAEDEFQTFLQRNRDYRSSPSLAFTADRLQRAVSGRQQIVSTLAESYEQARIEEVRDTPSITVVERPEAPVRPDSRRLVPLLLLAFVGGVAAGGIGVLARTSIGRLVRSEDPAAVELRAVLASTRDRGQSARRTLEGRDV